MNVITAQSHRLVLLRHAKADWPDVPDHDRPLADRGRHDAAEVGRWLRGAGVVPDLVVCSNARRTRQSWRLVARQLGAKPRVTYTDRLYEASVASLLDVVHETPDEVETLLLLGHNPGIQALTVTLAGSAVGDTLRRVREAFPTSCLAVLTFTGPWAALEPSGARLVDVAAPRG